MQALAFPLWSLSAARLHSRRARPRSRNTLLHGHPPALPLELPSRDPHHVGPPRPQPAAGLKVRGGA